MAVDTTTIRVPRETRDLLAREARVRGVSLASMLSALARDVAREAAFRSEREATLAEARNPAVQAEDQDWESVVGDGLS
jgi:hypothetical protein